MNDKLRWYDWAAGAVVAIGFAAFVGYNAMSQETVTEASFLLERFWSHLK